MTAGVYGFAFPLCTRSCWVVDAGVGSIAASTLAWSCRVDLSELNGHCCEWLTARCTWEAQQDRAERLAAGEPLEVPRWYFGGRSIPRQDEWPAWLRDHFGGVRSVRVHADDTIEACRCRLTRRSGSGRQTLSAWCWRNADLER